MCEGLPPLATGLVLPPALGRRAGDHPLLRPDHPGPAAERGDVGRQRGGDAGGDRRRVFPGPARRAPGVRPGAGRGDPPGRPSGRGALYVAEVAASCARTPVNSSPTERVAEARSVVEHPELGAAIDRAMELERRGASLREAAEACGTTGYVVPTVAFATFCFLRHGDDPMWALSEAISAGGDTDSIGAILGAWLGALHGEAGLPGDLIGRIHDGPFGPSHLRALAACLAALRDGRWEPVPRYSPAAALVRNLALCPVILGHGFRRLIPF